MGNIAYGIPTQRARDEIVNSISTLILVHTMYPNSDDYTVICRRLVEKHPKLRDSVGSGYVSSTIYHHACSAQYNNILDSVDQSTIMYTHRS